MRQPYGACASDNWRLAGNAAKNAETWGGEVVRRRSQPPPFGILTMTATLADCDLSVADA